MKKTFFYIAIEKYLKQFSWKLMRNKRVQNWCKEIEFGATDAFLFAQSQAILALH